MSSKAPTARAVAEIGRRFAEERARLKVNQDDLADELGVTRKAVGNYERGVNWPGGEVLFSLAKKGGDVLYILTGRRAGETSITKEGFVMVPRFDLAASAGHGAMISSEQVVDYLAFKADWVRNALGVSQRDLAVINVKGDSMEPTLSDGDLVLINMRKPAIEGSGVYVIRLAEALMVKRVQLHLDGSLTVASDNPKYTPEHVGPKRVDDLTVIGRVVWAGRRV